MRAPALLFSLLTLLTAAMAISCQSGTSSSLADLQVGEATLGDLSDSDVVQPEETFIPPDPLLTVSYDPFLALPDAGPAIFVSTTSINGPNLVTLFVKARNLATIAGLAFYLEYDPSVLRLEAYDSHVDLGSTGPYFTRSVTHELTPGVITYGAARFCKAKIPWGSTDQCGGQEVQEETTIASFTFALLKPGTAMVRFPLTHTLVRRPDRETVLPAWVGGTVVVAGEVTP